MKPLTITHLKHFPTSDKGKDKAVSTHTIKTYRGSRGTASPILNHCNKLKSITTSHTNRFTLEKEPRYSVNRRIGGPQPLWMFRLQKKNLAPSGIQTTGCQSYDLKMWFDGLNNA